MVDSEADALAANAAANEIDPKLVVLGRIPLAVSGLILFVLGLAQIVESAQASQLSSRQFDCAWYVGMVAVIAGARGLYLQKLIAVGRYFLLCLCTMIIGVVGTAMSHANNIIISSLSACSMYYSGDKYNCQSTPSPAGFTCYGDATLYYYAQSCEIDYKQSNGFTSTHSQCSCISSDTTGTCHDFSNIDDCADTVLNKLPTLMNNSYYLCIFIMIGATLSLVLIYLTLYCPVLFGGKADDFVVFEDDIDLELVDAAEATQLSKAEYVNGGDYVASNARNKRNSKKPSGIGLFPALSAAGVPNNSKSNKGGSAAYEMAERDYAGLARVSSEDDEEQIIDFYRRMKPGSQVASAEEDRLEDSRVQFKSEPAVVSGRGMSHTEYNNMLHHSYDEHEHKVTDDIMGSGAVEEAVEIPLRSEIDKILE